MALFDWLNGIRMVLVAAAVAVIVGQVSRFCMSFIAEKTNDINVGKFVSRKTTFKVREFFYIPQNNVSDRWLFIVRLWRGAVAC